MTLALDIAGCTYCKKRWECFFSYFIDFSCSTDFRLYNLKNVHASLTQLIRTMYNICKA